MVENINLTIQTHNGKITRICDKNTKTLFLYMIQMTEFPDLGQLLNLNELSLSNNNLIELSPEINKLVNLNWLNVCYNSLKQLPFEIGALVNLTCLYLYNNQLTTIPIEISKLTKLN